MAERRMFSKKIIDTDRFLDMPTSTRLLYYDLCIRADDDGFVGSPKKIARVVGCGEDDLKLLTAKQFIIPFESGICVIKDWRIHNYIPKDRYHETQYQDEMACLQTEKNGSYTLCIQPRIQPVPSLETEARLGKVSINNIHSPAEPDEGASFCKEVLDYLNQKMGTRYKSTTKKNRELIRARKREGYGLEDFKKVIDVKCDEWNHPPRPGEKDMRKFIRPETLFGTKFESYLNQPGQAQPCEPTEEGDIW